MNIRNYKKKMGQYIRSLIVFKHRFMGIEIGEGCFISLGAWLDDCRGMIIIGDKVSITRGAKILSHDATTGRLLKKTPDKGCKTLLENHCFIGMNAVILAGVHVGEHSIVGAGCVVSKDVPDFSVVVGNPMRIIKQYDAESKKWMRLE
jgi:acetyltransferase-like isoleucine patch superfamily enzyme